MSFPASKVHSKLRINFVATLAAIFRVERNRLNSQNFATRARKIKLQIRLMDWLIYDDFIKLSHTYM